jgi:hypothetical protein
MSLTPYSFSPSVRWITVHDFSIVLDVSSDVYLSVPARQFEALLSRLNGDASMIPTAEAGPTADLDSLINELAARRILLPGTRHRIERDGRLLPRPELQINRAPSRSAITQAQPYAGPFIKACLVADYFLRFRPFSQAVSRIATRKGTTPPGSLESMIRLTQVFHALRPFYPRDYLCLFDSLALLEFLATQQLFPSWVFGVSVDPFEAHCWVQQDSTVLCDTWKFRARWCSQIMVI